MRISPEKLAAEAQKTGFRPDLLEKVAQLLGLLEAIQSHPYLRNKLVLKGGTALNLFVFDVSRLSIDIDLNYIGSPDRDLMLAERPKVEQALHAVFGREDFKVRRMPEEHAGGKWSLRYASAPGQSRNLEVDINFMHRLPLWPISICNSHAVASWRARGVPVLDRHELAAGKLAALLARNQARDLFDSDRLFRMDDLDPQQLRIGFVVYGAMNRKDWRGVSAADVDCDSAELERRLIPTLRLHSSEVDGTPQAYGARLVESCRQGLNAVLPLAALEREFLDRLLDQGIIDPTLLTEDTALQQRIRNQPLLAWKALNVRRHKGLPEEPAP